MAWGIQKSLIVKKSIENDVSSLIPATYLQKHKNATLVINKECSNQIICL